MKEKQITTLQELRAARDERRSVFVKDIPWQPKPAAVVLNMSADCVLRMMERGMFVYEKPARHPWGKKK